MTKEIYSKIVNNDVTVLADLKEKIYSELNIDYSMNEGKDKLEIKMENLYKNGLKTNWFIQRIVNFDGKDIFIIRKRGKSSPICVLEIKDGKVSKLSGRDVPKFLFDFLSTIPIELDSRYKDKLQRIAYKNN